MFVFKRMHIAINRLLQMAALALVCCSIALPCAAAAPGEAADAPTSGTAQRQRPPRNIFGSNLNNVDAFNNRGIATYYHKSLISKKLHFNGQEETEAGYTVYLPPDYETSGERYPVLYYLHGMGAKENDNVMAVEKADELIRSGEFPPFIIVSPAAGIVFYGNHFGGNFQFHDYFIDEFIPYIDATYRTKADREYRHIQGFSMGGYGALMFTAKHPGLFGAVTDIAGALLGPRFNVWPEMYNSSEENFRPFDLYVLTDDNREALKSIPISIWVASEDICRRDNEMYHAHLNEIGVPHEYNDWNARPLLKGGQHNLRNYFDQYGKEILEFHAKLFKE